MQASSRIAAIQVRSRQQVNSRPVAWQGFLRGDPCAKHQWWASNWNKKNKNWGESQTWVCPAP